MATSEFVVPRSMPTAREKPGVHGALTRDWPGSAIWKSASAMGRPLALARLVVRRDLVEKTPVVAQRDELARRGLEPLPRPRARQALGDARHGLRGARAHDVTHARDPGVVLGEARLAQLLAQLEDLHEQGRRGGDAARARAAVVGRELDALELEQIFGPLDRVLEGPPGLVELHRPLQRRAPRARVGPREAIRVQLARQVLVAGLER